MGALTSNTSGHGAWHATLICYYTPSGSYQSPGSGRHGERGARASHIRPGVAKRSQPRHKLSKLSLAFLRPELIKTNWLRFDARGPTRNRTCDPIRGQAHRTRNTAEQTPGAQLQILYPGGGKTHVLSQRTVGFSKPPSSVYFSGNTRVYPCSIECKSSSPGSL